MFGRSLLRKEKLLQSDETKKKPFFGGQRGKRDDTKKGGVKFSTFLRKEVIGRKMILSLQ